MVLTGAARKGSVACASDQVGDLVQVLKNLAETLMQVVGAFEQNQSMVHRAASGNFYDVVSAFEAQLISDALRRTNGSQKRAAEILGLKITTLNTKIKQLRRSGGLSFIQVASVRQGDSKRKRK
jgi:DNA-binding NtrC family response regulator